MNGPRSPLGNPYTMGADDGKDVGRLHECCACGYEWYVTQTFWERAGYVPPCKRCGAKDWRLSQPPFPYERVAYVE